jgi:hypothetical protein
MEDTEGGTYGIMDNIVVCGSGNRAVPLIMGIMLFGTLLRFLFLMWETLIVHVNMRHIIIAFEPMRAQCMNHIAAPCNRCAILIHFCRRHLRRHLRIGGPSMCRGWALGRVYMCRVLIVVIDGTSNDVTVVAIMVWHFGICIMDEMSVVIIPFEVEYEFL